MPSGTSGYEGKSTTNQLDSYSDILKQRINLSKQRRECTSVKNTVSNIFNIIWLLMKHGVVSFTIFQRISNSFQNGNFLYVKNSILLIQPTEINSTYVAAGKSVCVTIATHSVLLEHNYSRLKSMVNIAENLKKWAIIGAKYKYWNEIRLPVLHYTLYAFYRTSIII